jgi:hypothetical protein
LPRQQTAGIVLSIFTCVYLVREEWVWSDSTAATAIAIVIAIATSTPTAIGATWAVFEPRVKIQSRCSAWKLDAGPGETNLAGQISRAVREIESGASENRSQIGEHLAKNGLCYSVPRTFGVQSIETVR